MTRVNALRLSNAVPVKVGADTVPAGVPALSLELDPLSVWALGCVTACINVALGLPEMTLEPVNVGTLAGHAIVPEGVPAVIACDLSTAALVVFAKAPQPGRVKTRLEPRLGKAGAARLHAKLVERAVRTAAASRLGRVELHCAPRVRHAFFASLARRHGLRLRAQGAGDLGARMQRAFERVLREADSALLIGSDCPALRAADLRAAARALRRGADAVLAPAEDGGCRRSKSSRPCSTTLALVRRSSTPSRFRAFPRKALRAPATHFGLRPHSWGHRSD